MDKNSENSENDMDIAAFAIVELKLLAPYDTPKKRASEININVAVNISFDHIGYDDPEGIYEDNEENDEDIPVKKSKRIRIFSDDILNTLNKWIDSHRSNPYPTEPEKLYLCEITGLNMTQINNWMSNARRRKLKVRSKRSCQTALK